ncbi:MAG: type II toxin-antitoxin system VapC family toxin [Limisphaerales bacterium]
MIVIDNNVLVRLVFKGDDRHPRARAVRGIDPDWHAPWLIRSEFRNVARDFHLRKRQSWESILAAASAAAAAVECHQVHDGEVLTIVRDGHLTASDAEFVAPAPARVQARHR